MKNPTPESDMRNIIKALGGATAVSNLCDLTPGAVSQWESSVPRKHLETILSEAKKKGLNITLEQLLGLEKFPANDFYDMPKNGHAKPSDKRKRQ